MAGSTTEKVMTTENLATFKTQMEDVIDKKVKDAATVELTYATERDILDLFTEPSADGGG